MEDVTFHDLPSTSREVDAVRAGESECARPLQHVRPMASHSFSGSVEG